MRTAPFEQKDLITENRARGNPIRSASCLRCWGLTRSSSRNATESVSRQLIRDTQTPRLKGMTKLSHTRSVESGFLTYTTALKRSEKGFGNIPYNDTSKERKTVRVLASVCVCVCVCVYVCIYVCIYVCMYVCIYVCMCVCMYAYVYVCMCVCMYLCMYACMCVYICMYIWICVYERMCVCMYVWMCVCMYVWMCIYVCMIVCMC
jgi:hypothetical protein